MTPETIAKLLIIVPMWGCVIGVLGMGIDVIFNRDYDAWTSRAGRGGVILLFSSLAFLVLLVISAFTIVSFFPEGK